ncbi:Hypothetical protein ERS075564_02745 [Mycobacteroides abscessus]|uniref:ABM domain-containing protein n=7 Tax=Mycobacteroides abscessus TaxID=36809 RepID=B1MGN1_MYCA9|nr:antibiotic biosynthesis monooxygenase [Mycobacteroides abscessus]AIC72967.1 hypothetical protein MYCMA_12950 [Mycobacteroides abscessus subsp. massiliense str. GO 06]ALM15246.1 hypothetical protein AOY11_02170 [Mycobacteroides abscessus]AMU24516.1 hypothetical protein A3N96_03035 [Mycobacteroides abscessus]AMU34246.1 hypothetical protein A3N98_02500 [Mycobacteroides abscessus]AMU39187.1 hypothetical protein A3N99_02500 [Mycobacteroides abscessus]
MLTGAAGACAPVYVCGEVTATLGAEDTVWGLLNVLLERTRYDPGNLGYEIFRDAGDLGHFLIQQTWKTPQLAERHLRSAAVSWCITRIQEAAHIPLRLTVCDVHRGHSKPAPPPLRSPLSTPAGVWAPSPGSSC